MSGKKNVVSLVPKIGRALNFFASMDRVNLAIRENDDYEQMLRAVLDVVLSVFDCDRTFLVHPVDLDSPTWQVAMERTRPEYPGVSLLGVELPMDPEVVNVFRNILGAPGPVTFGPGTQRYVPKVAIDYSVQSMLAMAIYPKRAKPYMFGMHQCRFARLWSPKEAQLFQAIGVRLADALSSLLAYRDLQRNEARLRQLAYYDPLTQLPNRRLLMDRLEQTLTNISYSGSQGALLFIDLDHFKILNDTIGHEVGDRLLCEVADRLTASVRHGDTIARLGGDEFVVILADLGDLADAAAALARRIAEQILRALNEPYTIGQRVLHSTPSIGVTLIGVANTSVDELIKQADIAMYEAKAHGRNTLRFFDPHMQAALAARVSLDAELRAGIERREFVLHFQPQMHSVRGVIGAEALLRWQHPERGLIFPEEFVPLAEETGLILEIGQWVLESACRQLGAWREVGALRSLCLAINVSARQFRQTDFVERVARALGDADAPAGRLKIELTESLVLDDVGDTIRKMEALKRLGVGFCIDDFGTGYSSLAYLTRLPLDQLKIDRSFVSHLPQSANDAIVVQTIITMARSLGLTAIAEGVETEAQREFLELQGCQACQGYLFSPPVALAAFEQLMS